METRRRAGSQPAETLKNATTHQWAVSAVGAGILPGWRWYTLASEGVLAHSVYTSTAGPDSALDAMAAVLGRGRRCRSQGSS